MGTGGCLGPKKNKDEIYIKLIREMHEESYKIPNNENLDIYPTIKQKIVKKGSLKKLIDNLSTRRHKIQESLNFNYKITSQAKQIQKCYVGLIIIDAVLELVYHPQSHTSQNGETIKKEEVQDDQSNLGKPLSVSVNRSKKSMIKFEPDRRLDLNQQIQTAYDEQYFRLVLFLFEHAKKMHFRLLLSLISFCRKQTRYIQCEHQVWKVIQKLGVNITKNIYLSQSCLLFNLLLQTTRDQASEQLRNHQTLMSVIKIWLFEKQSKQKEADDIEHNCHQIISIHFQKCICSWYSHFLYEVIFSVYDTLEFRKSEHDLLEEMYEGILESLDMHDNFLRGLFNYLLCYLSVTHESYVAETDKKWFSASFNMSYQKIRYQYRNILNDHVKAECFRLVNSWISKKYILIDQFCLYNSKALIHVYLSNSKYYRKNPMMTHIMDQYFKTLSSLNISSRALLVERLVEDLSDATFTVVEYEMLIRLMTETVYRNLLKDYEEGNMQRSQNKNIQKNPENRLKDSQNGDGLLGLYLVAVSPKYSAESNLEILKLVGYLIEKKNKLILNEEARNKICELMHSIYCYILLHTDGLYSKYQFTCAALSLCRILAYRADSEPKDRPHASLVLSLFLQSLVKEVITQLCNNCLSLASQYMLVYMIEQLKCMLDRASRYGIELTNINNKITPEQKQNIVEKEKQIEQLMVSFVTVYFQELVRDQSEFETQGKFCGEIYEEYKSIYGRLFLAEKTRNSSNLNTLNKFELSRKLSRDSESFSVYSVHSVNSAMCDKCRETWEKNNPKDVSMLNKPCPHLMKKNWRASDTSFQEIMDIVHI